MKMLRENRKKYLEGYPAQSERHAPTSSALLGHGIRSRSLASSRHFGGSGIGSLFRRKLFGGFSALALLMAAIVELLVSSLFLHDSIMAQIPGRTRPRLRRPVSESSERAGSVQSRGECGASLRLFRCLGRTFLPHPNLFLPKHAREDLVDVLQLALQIKSVLDLLARNAAGDFLLGKNQLAKVEVLFPGTHGMRLHQPVS